jgi:hypothetical protein
VAYNTVCRLLASPAEAVALIATHVRPVTRNAPAIQRLIADLDAKQFATRQAALRELARQWEESEAPLSQALRGGLSLEARQRAETLLGKIRQTAVATKALQRLRALEVLEHAGTAEARKLLERLAAGAEGARLTQAARSSVERLARRGR